MRGGQPGRSTQGRRIRTRPVGSIDTSVGLNRALWVLAEEMRKLIIYKFTRYPLQTFRLLRRFVRFMPLRDVLYLIVKPFLGKKAGATNAEVVSRAVEHAEAKSAAADMTAISDDALELAIAGSKAERARIQAMAEATD